VRFFSTRKWRKEQFMAARRMFAKSVVESARFLKMPVSSQNLYFHLGMNADDDGVVEAYAVMSLIRAHEDDLKVLLSKGFIRILNEDLVSYIKQNVKLESLLEKVLYHECLIRLIISFLIRRKSMKMIV
jgi:hypothetical protein